MFFNQTPHKDGSFVMMRSDIIKIKCERTLIWIKEAREEKIKNLMDSARAKIMQGFWHRLFKKPIPTDDQVKAYLDYELFFAQVRYGNSEAIANKLLNACKYADEIYVSTEDLERL